LVKGEKARTIPLSGKTAGIVGDYIIDLGRGPIAQKISSLFQNSRGSRLYTVGISEILNKYVCNDEEEWPHPIRHGGHLSSQSGDIEGNSLLRAGVPTDIYP
jgi:site-specific recombinase XerD